jgi:mono/diheme cytochrome c family protein
MKVSCLLLVVPVIAVAPNAAAAAAADDPYAAQLFAQHCASCHEAAGGAAARIPPVLQLKILTPTAILKTLESGVGRRSRRGGDAVCHVRIRAAERPAWECAAGIRAGRTLGRIPIRWSAKPSGERPLLG